MPKFAAGTMYRRLARPALSVFLVLKGLESGAKWEIWLVQQTLSSTDSAHRVRRTAWVPGRCRTSTDGDLSLICCRITTREGEVDHDCRSDTSYGRETLTVVSVTTSHPEGRLEILKFWVLLSLFSVALHDESATTTTMVSEKGSDCDGLPKPGPSVADHLPSTTFAGSSIV